MPPLKEIKSYNFFKKPECFFETFRCFKIITRSVGMTGIDTYANPRLILNLVYHELELLEFMTHIGSLSCRVFYNCCNSFGLVKDNVYRPVSYTHLRAHETVLD